MNWHYKSGEQTIGPIARSELLQLKRTNAISDDTLVLCTGLPGWVPYREASPESVEDAPVPDAQPTAPPAAPQPRKVLARAPASHSAPITQAPWAARLRASHSPRVAPLPPPLPLRPAGFWIRVVARIIDGMFLTLVCGLLASLWLLASHGIDIFGEPPENVKAALPDPGTGIAFLLVFMTYSTVCHWRLGATLGKQLCRLKLTTLDCSELTLLCAWWRFVAESLIFAGMLAVYALLLAWTNIIRTFPGFVLAIAVAWPMLCVGYVLAAFTHHKRGLHDLLAGTRVIRL